MQLHIKSVLEQRFGRIHRIGQTEVCHLWNLVADETREGEVYLALLKKLEIEQQALGGKVFDVLGKAIAGKELRELLIDAIRYGNTPEVRARLNEVVHKLDQDKLRELLEERTLARDAMDFNGHRKPCPTVGRRGHPPHKKFLGIFLFGSPARILILLQPA